MREVIAVSLISVVLGILVPTIALFVLGGAGKEANLIKFFFYSVMLFASVVAIDFVRLFKSEGFFSDNPSLETFSRMTVHSPTNTILYQKLKDVEPVGSFIADTVKKPSKLFVWFYGLSIALGAFIGVSGTFVSNIPQFFTEGTSISASRSLLLAVEPAVISETLFWFVFFFYSVVGSIGYLFYERLDFDLPASVIIGKFVAVPLTTVMFTAYHLFRYSNSQADLLGVAFLGGISSLTVAVFDSIIPAYLVHASGNFFNKAQQLGLFANELVVVGTVLFGVVSIIGYMLVIDPYRIIREE